MTLLQTRGLSVGLRQGADVLPVLRGLDLDLAPGRVLGLVGESGAGKSMLGRAIAQQMPPGFAVTGGALHFAGQDLVGMAPGRRRELLGRDIAQPRAQHCLAVQRTPRAYWYSAW